MYLWILVLTSFETDTCSDGTPMVSCFTDPCGECPNYPNARCEANYCGGCNAVYYDENGNNVTAYCRTYTGMANINVIIINIPYRRIRLTGAARYLTGECSLHDKTLRRHAILSAYSTGNQCSYLAMLHTLERHW